MGSWKPLGPSWAVFGASWAVLERRKAEKAGAPKSVQYLSVKLMILGISGPSSEASWKHIGASWRPLGPSWVHLRRLGALCRRPRGLLDCLGGVLGPSWPVLGPSWARKSHVGDGDKPQDIHHANQTCMFPLPPRPPSPPPPGGAPSSSPTLAWLQPAPPGPQSYPAVCDASTAALLGVAPRRRAHRPLVLLFLLLVASSPVPSLSPSAPTSVQAQAPLPSLRPSWRRQRWGNLMGVGQAREQRSPQEAPARRK